MESFVRQRNLLVSIRQIPTLGCTQKATLHPEGDHGRYVVNGVYGDSLTLVTAKFTKDAL